MNEQQILEQLIALLAGEGVTIRRDELGGSGGGLCTIQGKPTFFIDTQATSGETAAVAADAVAKTVHIEDVYIRPEIREFIENHENRVM